MKTHLFNGNQHVGSFSIKMYERWKNFKHQAVVFFKRLLVISGASAVIAVSFMAGGYLNPTVMTKAVEVVKEVEFQYPVLDKIAKAESYNSQFCTKDIAAKAGCHKYEIGAVLIHVNSNGTYDIGKYAINSTHLSEATKLGYDVYKENDNFEFAKYLFRNQGSEPWSASKQHWNN